MELVKQHQLAIDIRNIIFHNDLFYLLIYTQIHWNIIVFDKKFNLFEDCARSSCYYRL